MISPEELADNLIKESKNPNCNRPELNILLQQLREAIQLSNDIQCFIGPVMKLLPCHNFDVKRTVYSLLPRICTLHPDTALLAANTIVKDCGDPNPNVKCIALSAAYSLPQILEYTNSMILLSFDDSNPKVRHTTVMGCGTLFKRAPDLVKEMGYVDRLYESIRDGDPVVVTSSLLVLDMVLASEGGVVVNRNMVNYLLRRLHEFPDNQLANILQVLGKYTPVNEEELFHEMSVLDPYLTRATSAAVTVSCINLFLFLIKKDHSYLMNDIIKRTLPVLQEFLQPSEPKTFMLIALDFFTSMIHQKKYEWLTAMTQFPNLFFIYEKDDVKVQRKKFFILPYVCTEENYKIILGTLKEKYCLNPKTGEQAMMCLSAIARRLTVDVGHECLKIFHVVLDSKNNDLCDTALNILQNIDLYNYNKNNVSDLLKKIFCNSNLIQNVKNVPALAILLGDFGELVQSLSPSILESFVQDFDTYEDENTKILILIASIKIFLKMPAKCQHILGEVFEKCMCNRNTNGIPDELYNKARKYYLLLEHDVELVKSILLNH